MPCRTDDWPDTNSMALDQCKKELDTARKESDRATRLLCALMKARDNVVGEHKDVAEGLLEAFENKELQKWWKRHQLIDAKRIAREEKAKKIAELEEQLRKLKEES